MNRIEVNVKTREQKTVQLTQIEIDDANDRTLAEPGAPTHDDIYNDVLKTQKVLKAFLKVYASQNGVTMAQLKSAIKAKM